MNEGFKRMAVAMQQMTEHTQEEKKEMEISSWCHVAVNILSNLLTWLQLVLSDSDSEEEEREEDSDEDSNKDSDVWPCALPAVHAIYSMTLSSCCHFGTALGPVWVKQRKQQQETWLRDLGFPFWFWQLHGQGGSTAPDAGPTLPGLQQQHAVSQPHSTGITQPIGGHVHHRSAPS